MEELLKLSLLERQILDFCTNSKITGEQFAMKFKNADRFSRQQAIKALTEHGFLQTVKAVNPETNRPRTLYFTTERGKKFIKEFQDWLACD